MGCKLSKSYLSIVEPSANQQLELGDISVMKNATELINHIEAKTNQNITCIFIFGGCGSNKGEFIFELFDERSNKLRNPSQCQYQYLHVESLITENIKARAEEMQNGCTNKSPETSHETVVADEKEREERTKTELSSIKKCLTESSNAITSNWVRQLIEKEIMSAQPNSKFVINLIPNQINLFKDSLYLKQGPHFHNFGHGFIAVNIISQSHAKKDMDVSELSIYQEVNDFFVEYFKNAGKLIEIRIEPKKPEPRIKLSRQKSAIKVRNSEHLASILMSHKGKDLNLNITEFEECSSKGPLFFLEDNQIVVGDEVIVVDMEETNARLIQAFVTEYLKVKEKPESK